MLEKIAKAVEAQVQKMKSEVSEGVLKERVVENLLKSKRKENLLEIFRKDQIHIIAEIKGASPSEGVLREQMNPVSIAGEYLANQATALSILTERDYFLGDPKNLSDIHSKYPEAFLLKKDFVIDPYQIFQAKLHGASSVLLIAALLGEQTLEKFYSLAMDLGVAPLVEVHDEEEMKIAKRMGACFIGVNNRNLKTMKVSLETSERLIQVAPSQALLISESGITSSEQIKRLKKAGYSGFLIGTHLMRSDSPGRALGRLIQEATVREATE